MGLGSSVWSWGDDLTSAKWPRSCSMAQAVLPLLCDVDGVLLDFDAAALPVINEICGTNLSPETLTTWDYFELPEVLIHKDEIWGRFREKGFIAGLQPFPEAQKALKTLRDVRVPVEIVTSPIVSSFFYEERVKSLWKHFEIRRKDICLYYRKERVRGIALVDDKPSNIVNWAQANAKTGYHCFLWESSKTRNLSLPTTIGSIRRTSNWEDIIGYCKTMLFKHVTEDGYDTAL